MKPWVSPGVRLALRKWYSRRQRGKVAGVWPILPGSEKPPAAWPGWPQGKQFAVVLTHDVEGPLGLSRCLELMEIDRRNGFRASFNFIPEGNYKVPEQLRAELKANEFEVGVHDLHHDGKLYRDFADFSKKAQRINHYLKEWESVGFRSGFMHHNLEWAHELNVLYESSTFDTDPFEPQPDGMGTIFPFWVERGHKPGTNGSAPLAQKGYVELPYTLVQDSTLFLLLGEKQPTIWMQKLDWIAKHGGMVLINTHPDYIAMNGSLSSSWEYPVRLYEDLLKYIRSNYSGAYWQVTPAELAKWYKGTLNLNRVAKSETLEKPRDSKSAPAVAEIEAVSTGMARRNGAGAPHRPSKPKVWIDLDNTPHVPFFEPIIDELRARGFPVLVTARDAFQVCDLADKKGIQYTKVGRHYGKHMLFKGAGLVYRAMQLAPLIMREKPALGVSHGARSQLLLGTMLRIPTVLIADYEYCGFAPMTEPTWFMIPSVIPDGALQHGKAGMRKYPGIKEDVYAWKLRPERHSLEKLGISDSDLLVTVRPPATEAHYHNPESEKLFDLVMERATKLANTRVVLLPRNRKQGEVIRQAHPEWFAGNRTIIPNEALDGMNLIWHSDLVVSGGGTMNREAAALGVPVYSIFRGTIGAVDRSLQSEGRLVLLESEADVREKLSIVRKSRKSLLEVTSTRTLQYIVDALEEIANRTLRAC